MPELPEVEVVRQGLQSFLTKEPLVLVRFEFLRKNLRFPIPIKAFQKIEGAVFLEIERRAKYLIFKTNQGRILSHLGMTGSWRRTSRVEEMRTHDHIRLHFSDSQTWVYHDPRRFGIFEVLDTKTEKKRFAHLGPEPLSAEFVPAVLKESLKNRRTSVKTAIMDQKVVVGVGNIYASEALFLAGIRPGLRADRLSLDKIVRLTSSIKNVLRLAIKAGGSTISDFEKANGESGYFQSQHQVYDRAGEPCRRCRTPIKMAVMGGRSTYWCPVCQK